MMNHVRTRWLFCLLAAGGCANDAAPHGADFVNVMGVNGGVCGNTSNQFRCWGDVYQLQVSSATPVQPAASYGRFRSVDTDPNYYGNACGLDGSGALYCWRDQEAPVAYAADMRFTQVSVGGNSQCALATSGTVYCWGAPESSGISPQDTIVRTCGMEPYTYSCVPVPYPIASSERFTSIASGEAHHCGLAVSGQVLCWGYGYGGTLGVGEGVEQQQLPAPVQSGERFTALAAGAISNCAVTTHGALLCWGYGQPYDEGTEAYVPTPITFPAQVSLQSVALFGYGTSCALDTSGAAWCWSASGGAAPRPVLGGLQLRSISVNDATACGISDSGAWCWGAATGDGSNRSSVIPVRVANQDQFDDD